MKSTPTSLGAEGFRLPQYSLPLFPSSSPLLSNTMSKSEDMPIEEKVEILMCGMASIRESLDEIIGYIDDMGIDCDNR